MLMLAGIAGAVVLAGVLILAFSAYAQWRRPGFLGILLVGVGVLLLGLALRGRNDALEIRRRGVVRISATLGTRVVAYDQIVAIEAIHGRSFPGNQPLEKVASVRVTTTSDQLVNLEGGSPAELLALLERETGLEATHLR